MMRSVLTKGLILLALMSCTVRSASADDLSRDKYVLFCAGCHGVEGEGGGGEGGTKKIFPFVASVGVFLNDPQGRRYLANVGGVTSAGMTATETAQVLNYILTTFATTSLPADFKPFTASEIDAIRKLRVDDPLVIRRELAARLANRAITLPPYEWD